MLGEILGSVQNGSIRPYELKLVTEGAVFRPEDELRGSKLEVGIAEPQKVGTDMAEACGSRTQTFNSQVTANDDVAASAKFQLESNWSQPSMRSATRLSGFRNLYWRPVFNRQEVAQVPLRDLRHLLPAEITDFCGAYSDFRVGTGTS